MEGNVHRRTVPTALSIVVLVVGLAVPSVAARTTDTLDPAAVSDVCEDLFGSTFALPSSEPLAACQWGMSLIGADSVTHTRATGHGVRVGDLDSGIDTTHPDIAPNSTLPLRAHSFSTTTRPRCPRRRPTGTAPTRPPSRTTTATGRTRPRSSRHRSMGSGSRVSRPRPPSLRSRCAAGWGTASRTRSPQGFDMPATSGSISST